MLDSPFYLVTFICGYIFRSLIAFYLFNKKVRDLQKKLNNGEHLPIIIKADINNNGGYTGTIFHQNGVHLTKKYRKEFIAMLHTMIQYELSKKFSEFKLLKFYKDK